ncbi:MAG: glycine--tRNA ligase subunit beta [Gammaproteobacteria bacterium]|jgi:glycyl-tRNA synthetase beta chain
MRKKDLLIEIGTEELPPKALRQLGESFAAGIQAGLDAQSLSYATSNWYATPRRLCVLVEKLVVAQEDQKIEKRGPALTAAYDAEGQPSKAASGFARSCNVELSTLKELRTDKGSWLIFRTTEEGKQTSLLIPGIIINALNKLPIPKRMRWGESAVEFVRPVHWSIVLFGNEVIPCEILDTTADNITYGHRFHSSKPIRIKSPKEYLIKLREKGRVIADFEERRQLIENIAVNAAKEHGGSAIINADLLDEVTSLVEWPVVVTGSFDEKFLELPREVLIATMQDHQKYFPIADDSTNNLLNRFITIANIQSTSKDAIRHGNERVIRPRLADAEFFWRRDCQYPFSHYENKLKDVVFQKQLGTLADKTERVMKLSGYIASQLNADSKTATRAAQLSKCDLFTEMVGEFPELQGVMGRYYALQSGESAEVAAALDEQYMPRFAGDELPKSVTGQILAIADKVDTIIGIFGIGQTPTGDKDPFGLRRAAIGILRILIENRLPITLDGLLCAARDNYPENIFVSKHEEKTTHIPVNAFAGNFIKERAKNFLREQGYTTFEVEAVVGHPDNNKPSEYQERLEAVRSFLALPEAADLAQADKRIQNIISKSDQSNIHQNAELDKMKEDQEKTLLITTRSIREQVDSFIVSGQFKDALILTAQLHVPVREFFEHVMVNAEDEELRLNRFRLLHEVGNLTNRVANISKLAS